MKELAGPSLWCKEPPTPHPQKAFDDNDDLGSQDTCQPTDKLINVQCVCVCVYL